jgi:hypothetical protein
MPSIFSNGATLKPKQVVYNGTDLNVVKNVDGTPVFSKHAITIHYISSVNQITLPSGRKYVDFGTAASIITTQYNSTILPNNQVVGQSVNVSEFVGQTVSTIFIRDIGSALYSTLLSDYCVPQLTVRSLSYIMPVRSKYISLITKYKKEWELPGGWWQWNNYGSGQSLLYVDAPYFQPSSREFPFSIGVFNGSNGTEEYKFKVDFANTGSITSDSRLCVKYIITRIGGASSVGNTGFTILGKPETLAKYSSSISGVTELGSLNGLNYKEFYVSVTFAPQTDYDNQQQYKVALTPFVISP